MAAAVLALGLVVPAGALSAPVAVLAEEPASTPQQNSPNSHEITLYQVFESLRELHWPKVDDDKLVHGAVQGMLEVLNDPYTEYFTANEYQNFVNSINQKYAGIGARMSQDDQGFLVEEVFASSPAEAAGIKKGDRVLAVNGTDVTGKQLQEVTGMLRGEAGTSVTVTLRRQGQAPFSVTVTRQQIQLPTLQSSLLDEDTGYIRILSFSENADSEFDKALADLQEKGIRSLVLDVRGNGGGIMGPALNIADRFLKNGTLLEIRYRNGSQKYNADSEGVDLPLVVLVDEESASASELLAGTLQAHKRAKLVGSQSFGKGVLQRTENLANGYTLKFTVGQFYFADGTSPQATGLKPDVPVKLQQLQVPAALRTLYPDRERSVTFDLANQKTYVDRIEITDQKTVDKNGTKYLPLRLVAEALGSEVVWDGSQQSISFQYGGRAVKLHVPTGKFLVNDEDKAYQEPFFVESGVTYVSLEALKEAFKSAQWQIGSEKIVVKGI